MNEERHIGRSIASAQQAGAHEIIVVDGGSHDHTPDIAREASCRLLESPPGRARQQNLGAANAAGDMLLFLHADNWLAPQAIDQIRVAMRDSPAIGGAFRQRIDAPGLGFRGLEAGNAARVRWLGLPYGDQGLFIRRAAFEQLHRFPEVRLLEDLLLMRQLRRIAWPLLLPGPIYVDARRWQRHGLLAQTMRNWTLLAAFTLGFKPDRLADFYRRHDVG